MYRETWMQEEKKFQSRRSVELEDGKRMLYWMDKLITAVKDQDSLKSPETGGTGKPVAPGYQGYPGNPGTSGNSEASETEGKFGHIISKNHWTVYLTWTWSSRSWDKDVVAARRIKWTTSMWTQLYGVYLCLSVFKLQFILGKTLRKIGYLPRINPWSLWDNYFKRLGGRSSIRQKLPDWPRLTGGSLCGKKQLCYVIDAQLCGKRTSCILFHQCLGKSRIEKQREKKEVSSLQR